MLRKFIIALILTKLLVSCTNTSKSVSTSVSNKTLTINHAQLRHLLTDSAKLIKHLDSLPTPKFPFKAINPSSWGAKIDLSGFKNRRLFNNALKLRYRTIGGSIIDGEDRPKTFDLTDSTFKADWLLIAKQPKYFVIITDGRLVTLTYNLVLIDAMNIVAGDPAGNSHFSGELNTTIYSNLKLKLRYEYGVQTDEERHYAYQIEDDLWFVNQRGQFKYLTTNTVKSLDR